MSDWVRSYDEENATFVVQNDVSCYSEVLDEQGNGYYYDNRDTEEATWEIPGYSFQGKQREDVIGSHCV